MASTGAKIVQAEIPSASEIYESRLSQFAASLAESLAQPLPEGEAMLHRLSGMGLTAEQVAEAALERLLAGQRKALPEVQVVSRRGESRDGKQTGVVLSIGRRQRIAPNFILGAIADATGIPGKQVGKIDIYDDYTVVQLGAEDARLTAETMATCRINGHKTEVRLLTKADLAGKNAGGRREERRPDKRGGKPYGRVDGNGRQHRYLPEEWQEEVRLGEPGRPLPWRPPGGQAFFPPRQEGLPARVRIPAESGK